MILVHVVSAKNTCDCASEEDTSKGYCATREFIEGQVKNIRCYYCREPLLWETEPCENPEHYRKAKEFYEKKKRQG